MEARFVYGTRVYTLSEVVDEWMMAAENVRRNHYLAYLNHTKWAWKKLMWSTIWSVKQVVLNVDPETNTVKLPTDNVRTVSLLVMDECNNLQAIVHDPNMAAMTVSCPADPQCSCGCGGKDTLCLVLDSISLRTEDVEIRGEIYKRRIYNRKDGSGNLQEVIEHPAWDNQGAQVIYTTQYRNLCKLEVNEKGCIKPTKRNEKMIHDHCGCFIYGFSYQADKCPVKPHCQVDIKFPDNGYGKYKLDANVPDLVHLRNVKATKIILTYQTSGECSGEEMLVPEYAVDAVLAKANHRRSMYNPQTSGYERRELLRTANREEMELMKFLSPIVPSEFLKRQGQIHKW